ncbi:cytochrome P450 [Armillaria borealis]|uniref:Cytochrome P450 n=1 Tax=Armillaria borealis TaxID=47425 RepID=A0AA39JKD2_9AGAR|nr:cytochrome P450 [Armillaria borealis]
MYTIHALSVGIALLAAILLLQRFSQGRSVVSRLPVAPAEEASILWGHEYKAALLGQVFRIKTALFQGDRVIVADNLVVQHIFQARTLPIFLTKISPVIIQNAYIYLKSQAFQPIVVKVVGRGVAWAEGEEHKFQRRLLVPAFTPSAVQKMLDDVIQCAEKCVSRLASEVDAQRNAGIINLSLYIPPCMLEIICRVGFGRDFGHESPDAQAILGSWREDVQKFSTFPAFLAPIVIGIFPWIAKLPIAALQEDGIAKKVIQRVTGDLLKQPSSPDGCDILSVLVRESWSRKDDSSAKLSSQQLLDNITTVVMAGFEASSGNVMFTLLDLARNIKVQTKLREELAGTELDSKSIENLPYLDAVTRESLRLHPSTAETCRTAMCDDTIPLRNPVTLQNGEIITALPVKAGDQFTIPFTLLNTNPAIWGPNAHEFIPERWMTPDGVPPSKDLPHGPWTNVSTFGDGPHACIGWRLAVMQIKIVLAIMIRAFEFKDSSVKIYKMMSPSLQPFVDGEAATLPLHISLVHPHIE